MSETERNITVLLVEDDEKLARLTALYLESQGLMVHGVADGRLVRIDPSAMRATLADLDLVLTTFEFTLLRVLAQRAGRVLGREQLMELVSGSSDAAFDRSIDVHISRLRQKLGDDPKKPRVLKTVRGVGYMLALERP